MAASKTVPEVSQHHNSIVPRHGIVTLFGYPVEVFVERGHLILKDGIGPDRRHFRLPRVEHGLRRLVVIGADGYVSLSALRWLADQKASFVMLDRDGSILLTTGPARGSDARLRRAQALAHSSGAALRIARELIHQKLVGQESVARNRLLNSSAGDTIGNFTNELPTAESITSLRLIEGQAAAVYWSCFRDLPINFPKNDLRYIPAHWSFFGTRISPLTGSPRLAANPPNAILNYLYAVLESEARLAAAALGLDPSIGVLHADQQARDSLACDLMEPVRPHVDAYLLDWITKQPLKRDWFFEERNGNCRLLGSFVSRLSETAPIWQRSVAPIAEWVAQALWRSSQNRSTRDEAFPTRLTQRRRREGRGHQFVAPTNPVPARKRVCEVCGAEGITNRYCQSCAVEVSRENMTHVALIGHARPKTARARKQISKKLSDHAVANTWWSPSSLPAWLTEEFYLHKIQPQLKTVKVREIAEVTHVSHAYAAFIRSGRRRPHRRHWKALAQLAGVKTEDSQS